MEDKHLHKIAEELDLKIAQVTAVAELIEQDATVPFIARYRKEATGSLDEVAITTIRDRLAQLAELDKRRESILKSLEERNLLTDELKDKIWAAETLATLEDIYLPYRPKRRTRATVAREKGLEPLALKIFDQDGDMDPVMEAAAFVDPEKGVESTGDALAGARDIMAEWINENQEARQKMRMLYSRKGLFRVKVIAGMEEQGAKYRDYFDLEEPVPTAPSHRILAMRRGAKEGFLDMRVVAPEDEALALLEALFVKGRPLRTATTGSCPAPWRPRSAWIPRNGQTWRPSGSLRRTCENSFWPRPWVRRPSWPSTPVFAPGARWSAWIARDRSSIQRPSFPSGPKGNDPRPPKAFPGWWRSMGWRP